MSQSSRMCKQIIALRCCTVSQPPLVPFDTCQREVPLNERQPTPHPKHPPPQCVDSRRPGSSNCDQMKTFRGAATSARPRYLTETPLGENGLRVRPAQACTITCFWTYVLVTLENVLHASNQERASLYRDFWRGTVNTIRHHVGSDRSSSSWRVCI
jgi:hypothetical protein